MPLFISTNVNNPATRVLAIPELLSLVFSFLNPQFNAANACVCKSWSDIALPVLWRNVHDLWNLVHLFGPLKKRLDSSYELVRPLQSSDWLRFTRYSHLVHNLRYKVRFSPQKRLHHSVFDEIGRTRLQLNILPNLDSLLWIIGSMQDLRMGVIFMHERVSKLVVKMPFDETNRNKEIEMQEVPYFQEVATRMPHLKHLDLRMDVPARLITKPFTSLLSSLSALETVILPTYHITSLILTTLSCLPRLGTIEYGCDPSQGSGSVADIQSVSPTLHSGAFPSLFNLSLMTTPIEMQRFLEMSFAPLSLKYLYVDCGARIIRGTEETRAFLACVSEVCRLLESLCLDLLWMNKPRVCPMREAEELITFETLEPLLRCRKFVEFTLVHDHSVQITQAQVTTLASQWPSLQMLYLSCEPVNLTTPSTLTLRALLPFAQHCPDLRELGLFVDASSVADLPDSFSSELSLASRTRSGEEAGDIVQFKTLSKLCMGVSDIRDEGTVALFLSHICPLGVEVDWGISWEDDIEKWSSETATADGLRKEISERVEKWETVGQMLPPLIRLRMKERERCRALEVQIEELKIQNRILIEKGMMAG